MQKALRLLANGARRAANELKEIQAIDCSDALTAAKSAIAFLTQELPSAANSLKEVARFAASMPRFGISQ